MSYQSSPTNDSFNQFRKETIRPMAVGGAFYPTDKDALIKLLTSYFKPYANKTQFDLVNAVIVPHAGYVFSGAVAASAFAQIDPMADYECIFLIGASHQVYIHGASINVSYDYYDTPLGKVKVDKEIGNKLLNENNCFVWKPEAHDREHCLEVQLPLLKYHLKKMPPIIPIIIGTDAINIIAEIAKALKPYFNKKCLFVISCDFSHYPNYEDANIADKRTGDAIMTGKIKDFLDILQENRLLFPKMSTSACGHSAVELLLLLIANDPNIQIHHIEYRNSGDSEYGDKDRVVGSHSFTFTRKIHNEEEFSLTSNEKQTLLHIARQTIANRLFHSNNPVCRPEDITDALKEHCGAFVTLHEHGKLRGCIGRFGDEQSLHMLIEEMAISAAFHDPRFYPLQPEELNDLDIEISVLTPLKRIHDINDFTLGKQGIYIEKNGRSGTFLPQVANDVNWTKEEFLGHCSQDKAGLGWDGWKDANLYTYEAIIFSEGEEL